VLGLSVPAERLNELATGSSVPQGLEKSPALDRKHRGKDSILGFFTFGRVKTRSFQQVAKRSSLVPWDNQPPFCGSASVRCRSTLLVESCYPNGANG
jgi:hypothetical protein